MLISRIGEALPVMLHAPSAGQNPQGKAVPIPIQHQFGFVRPLAARVRSVRRPFNPTPREGNYRLPHEIRDRLALALAPFRNRDNAFALANFLARYWSTPARVMGSFPVDRRALAQNVDLGLSEGKIRGAITTLEAVGYIERAIPPAGSRYRMTENGGLHRKVILFAFGSEYGPLLIAANKRARAARGSNSSARRSIIPTASQRPPTAILEANRTNSPKSKSQAKPKVIMGKLRGQSDLPLPTFAPTSLDAALERLRREVFGHARTEEEAAK